MSLFKDFVISDLDTFLNLEEFAYDHIIDDKKIKCVLDSDIFQERRASGDEKRAGGVYEDVISLFVKMEDITKPKISDRMMVDGEFYTVKNVIETDGLFEIQLLKNDY